MESALKLYRPEEHEDEEAGATKFVEEFPKPRD